MATFVTHLISGAALGAAAGRWKRRLVFAAVSAFLSVLPDIDAVAFRLGIPYGDPMGHRGFAHSIVFALLIAVAAALVIDRGFAGWKRFAASASVFFTAVMMHGVLDAMTSGGLGVGFFIPFSMERYFLPWRPIPVSPISIRDFISGADGGGLLDSRGLYILGSEASTVIIPVVILCAAVSGLRYLAAFLVRRRRERIRGNVPG
ncbi:MAG: metal-dependent hydrolase [Spirochaetes bacterium]|jgi:inner membrane protein|nr:metal-dependent hydrolase [Spirochaetota bacterium]